MFNCYLLRFRLEWIDRNESKAKSSITENWRWFNFFYCYLFVCGLIADKGAIIAGYDISSQSENICLQYDFRVLIQPAFKCALMESG